MAIRYCITGSRRSGTVRGISPESTSRTGRYRAVTGASPGPLSEAAVTARSNLTDRRHCTGPCLVKNTSFLVVLTREHFTPGPSAEFPARRHSPVREVLSGDIPRKNYKSRICAHARTLHSRTGGYFPEIFPGPCITIFPGNSVHGQIRPRTVKFPGPCNPGTPCTVKFDRARTRGISPGCLRSVLIGPCITIFPGDIPRKNYKFRTGDYLLCNIL